MLDEIGDMPVATQAKLLRVLQEREVRPVGGGTPHAVDVRVIAATHQDLEARVGDGGFRADLYYRLAVVPLAVPPLRDRTDDIPLLARHFLARARAACPGSPVVRFTDDALEALAAYPWPGNVRELENLVERVVVLGNHAEVTGDDVRAVFPGPAALARLRTLREVEDDYIDLVLARCGANKTRAAEILGVNPSTLYRRRR
jgi:two-component system response regulator HydG